MRYTLSSMLLLGLFCGGSGLVQADEQADVQAVIDKAIAAVGGMDKITKNKASIWKAKGKFYGLGEAIEFTGEWTQQLPTQSKSTVEFEFGGNKLSRVQVFNGTKGWASMMGNTEDMNEEQLGEAKSEMYTAGLTSLAGLKDAKLKFKLLGDGKVGDRPTVGLQVNSEGQKEVKLHFDKEKGLLLKVDRKAKNLMSGEEQNQETLFSDYQELGGLMRAKKQMIKRDGMEFLTFEITEFKAEARLPDSAFNKPGDQ